MCVLQLLGVLLSLLLLLVLSPTAQGSSLDQNLYASACNEEILQLRCPDLHRVAIKRVFHGVKSEAMCGERGQKPRTCCRASHLDCMVNDDSKYLQLNARCSGQPTCSTVVTAISTGNACNASQPRTHYITVIYYCVPEADIVHLCSDSSKHGPVLYLANREYPSHTLTSQAECSCLIRAKTPGIAIHSIDVQLAPPLYGHARCSKALSIRDPFAFFKQYSCGHRGLYGFRNIYNRPVRNATVSLESSHREGTAYLWFQIKPSDAEEVEIFCGEARHNVLLRASQQAESRHRDQGESALPPGGQPKSADSVSGHGSNITSLSPDLAAIVGGIVAAAFVLFAIVIIAIAVHCRRVREAKERRQTPIHMYPASGGAPPLALSASYCHYDADLDTYCSISRSPMKLAHLSHLHPPDTLPEGDGESEGEADGYAGGLGDGARRPRTRSQPSLPAGLGGGEDDCGVAEGGGLRTLPGHRSMLVSAETKSPLGKRSKSVTFSQPVAKVTPLPSGSEESFEADHGDELSKMADDVFPDKLPPPPPELADDLPRDYLEDTYPLPPPPRPETIPIAVGGGGQRESPPRPMSTFHSPEEPPSPKSPLLPKAPLSPPQGKGGLPYDSGNYYRGREQAFWKPNKTTGSRDSGEIFEVGV